MPKKQANQDAAINEDATAATETKPENAPVIANAVTDFDDETTGEVVGASYPRLELMQNQVSMKLEYVKEQVLVLPSQDNPKEMEELKVPCAKGVDDGVIYALPVSAIFKKNLAESNLDKGDVFAFKRYTDAVKKHGRGQGNKMRVYGIKVYSRAEKEQ